ncbi:hypothetical protein Afil01_42690 [Actinorhabdospora filicis]|uniref:DUF397 domain-containing protein n=1 Tax=Actinorhabdospora filicis TaxID=1785913 RepID=A0A9W6W4N7_9ACTN|nr:DUF397 domain-containing protein [Actinorhabdospora filicis]GLZ79462.1 hypothetical protein Afil01_42690 [Actinorhabdospora filicis]
MIWRKSSYSPNAGGQCVEIGPTLDHIAVRDSKDRHGPVLTTSHSEWAGFARDLRTGLLDR